MKVREGQAKWVKWRETRNARTKGSNSLRVSILPRELPLLSRFLAFFKLLF